MKSLLSEHICEQHALRFMLESRCIGFTGGAVVNTHCKMNESQRYNRRNTKNKKELANMNSLEQRLLVCFFFR